MHVLRYILAARYLFSRKSHSVINLIAGVSVVAVAVPVAAMIVLLSVFNGFETLVKQMYASFDADIEITAADARPFGRDAVAGVLASQADIDAASFYLERQVLLCSSSRQSVATLRGVDTLYPQVVPVAKRVALGDGRVQLGELNRVLLGQGLAYALGIYSTVGQTVGVCTIGGGQFSALMPETLLSRSDEEVCGLYSLDAQTDRRYALTSLRLAQQLFGAAGRCTAAALKVRDGANHERIARGLQQQLGDSYRVATRETKNAAFYRIMRYEKWGVFFISLLVLVIASFSIAGTLMILIVEKQNDTATLRALGADNRFLQGVFRSEAVLISALGAVLGLVLGVSLVAAQQHWGIIKMPADTFLVANYPVQLQGADVAAVVAAAAMVTVVLAVVTTKIMIKRR